MVGAAGEVGFQSLFEGQGERGCARLGVSFFWGVEEGAFVVLCTL